MDRRRRVLVTGTSGRIAAAVVRELARDHDVVGLDRRAGPLTDMVGEITDAALLERATAGVDAIVHTAALHAPHVGEFSDQAFVDVNVGGTERIVEAAQRRGISRLVFTSTTSLYGDAMVADDRAVWVDEALVPRPRDIYDETKLAAERICAGAASERLTCISLRMSRCFPEPERLMHVYRLYRGVDERDVAAAHRAALEVVADGYDVFNVSAPPPFRPHDMTSIYEDAAAVIAHYYPWAPQAFAARGWRLPVRIDRCYVIDKAREALGYAPRYDFGYLFGH